MEGRLIGQYRVTGVIGQGGMGAVYTAEHTLLGRPAAIKVLLPELSQKQEIVQRFFNEARAATAIRHPGIIEVYDFGWTSDGAAYLVMERLEGDSLERRMSRGALAWPAALALARQIAGALGAAHAKGIVHRDLKPDNMFLVRDPEVPGGERIKLLDFGIAKLAGESSQANVTRTGQVIGTPTYMSPEQCRGVAVDHRADLYALGCVLFELCAGRPAFVGEGAGDVLAAHIYLPPPTLGAAGVAAPPAVEQLLASLLAKQPAQRPPSTDAVIAAIDAALTDRSVGTSAIRGGRASTATPHTTTLSGSAAVRPALPPVPRPATRRNAAIIAAVAGLATVLIVVVIMSPSAPATAPSARADGAAVRAPAAAVPAPEARVASAAPTASPTGSAAAAGSANAGNVGAATGGAARVVPSPPGLAGSAAPLPRTVELRVDTVPAGAQVWLDGALLGKTPLRRAVPRGERSGALVVRLAGYAERRASVRLDREVGQQLTLVKEAPPARKRDASVNPFAE